jgi:hypothetical protein
MSGEAAGRTASGPASNLARRIRTTLILDLVFGFALLLGGCVGLTGPYGHDTATIAVAAGVFFVVVGLSLGGPLVTARKLAADPTSAAAGAEDAFRALGRTFLVQTCLVFLLAALAVALWVRANF